MQRTSLLSSLLPLKGEPSSVGRTDPAAAAAVGLAGPRHGLAAQKLLGLVEPFFGTDFSMLDKGSRSGEGSSGPLFSVSRTGPSLSQSAVFSGQGRALLGLQCFEDRAKHVSECSVPRAGEGSPGPLFSVLRTGPSMSQSAVFPGQGRALLGLQCFQGGPGGLSLRLLSQGPRPSITMGGDAEAVIWDIVQRSPN
eukprot:scaffold213322_cov15-Tisochrysis_lutea.AAC.1